MDFLLAKTSTINFIRFLINTPWKALISRGGDQHWSNIFNR
jgi:hypothetical protein